METSTVYPAGLSRTTSSWAATWLTAVARPTVAIYRDLARQADVKARHAWLWMFGSSAISAVLVSGARVTADSAPTVDLGLALAAVAFALIVVLTWVAFGVCTNGIARLLKGRGTSRTLVYVCAAFNAPLLLLAAALSVVPLSGPVMIVLYLYWLVLNVVAVRAVHDVSRTRALGAVLLSLMLIGCVVGGLGLLMLA